MFLGYTTRNMGNLNFTYKILICYKITQNINMYKYSDQNQH